MKWPENCGLLKLPIRLHAYAVTSVAINTSINLCFLWISYSNNTI